MLADRNLNPLRLAHFFTLILLKILPANSLVVVVSPLNALIADQRESCQKLKLKAVEMERELFDNDDTLKELKNAEVLYCSPETF